MESAAEVTCNLDSHSEAYVIIIVCSPQAIFNIFKVYILFFPSLKHNVMQTLCPFKSAIFQVRYNFDCNNTPLYVTRYYPAVTCGTALFQACIDCVHWGVPAAVVSSPQTI